MLTPVRRAALLAVALSLVVLVPNTAASAAAKQASGCKAGQVPKKSAKKVVCTTFKLPAGAKPAAAPRSAQGELAQLTDQLQTALELVPKARAKLDKRVGKKRTGKVVALALEGWQKKAGIAAAPSGQVTTQSFGSAGAGGKATLDIGAYDDGRSGWHVAAEAEVELTRSGLDALGAGDDLPSGIDGGKAKVKLTFDDILAACPSAAGTVAGRLEASGSLSIDIKTKDGTTSIDLAASAAMTYIVKVGDDGKWYKIDDTTLKAKFSAGGTGQKTKSYYGNVSADGYGTESILGAQGAGGTKAAIERDLALGTTQGAASVSGPSGTWSTKAGKEKVDVLSLLDYKAMMATYIATQLINVAAIEYLRAIALPRGQKHWYDEEGCLTADGSASPSDKLKPGATATVTVNNVKARDGGAVPGSLTATGVASIAPGSASLAPGGSAAFTLTAPGQPGTASWQVVVVSRGGKKTVNGSIPVKKEDLPVSYSGTMDAHSVYFGGIGDQLYDGTLRFTRTSQDDFPDGSRNAWYKLTSASISLRDTQTQGVCGEYRYEGTGTDVVGGDLELQVSPTGAVTAAYAVDVSFGNVVWAGIGAKPQGCPGSAGPGLAKVVFNSRNSTNDLRPTAADLALSMPTATDDLSVNTGLAGMEHTTARWSLTPGY
ncbi:hypothetical protein [Baekduia sp. Peel2402]|uniref:hypothetical protein n=1 Tax=Baekduia sp. Peel2402 TaxID=3458296 RepID=UPI00403E858A